MIYLHQTKAEVSYFGGKIDCYDLKETVNSHQPRIVFALTYVPEARNVRWPRPYYDRAWTSGVIDD